VLAAVQTAARRLRRWPAASLDRGCARRSTEGQVGTKGWVCPIEQRDASFDLRSAHSASHDRFAELRAHNCLPVRFHPPTTDPLL